jgi:hypothetical protein
VRLRIVNRPAGFTAVAAARAARASSSGRQIGSVSYWPRSNQNDAQ